MTLFFKVHEMTIYFVFKIKIIADILSPLKVNSYYCTLNFVDCNITHLKNYLKSPVDKRKPKTHKQHYLSAQNLA